MTTTMHTQVLHDWESWLQLNMPSAVRTLMRDEWLVLCPFHADRNPSCAVNTSKGVFVCRSCGAKGHMRTFQRKVGGENPDVARSTVMLRQRLTEAFEARQEMPRLSERWLDQFSPDNGYWTDYRGLLPETVKRYRLRIDSANHEAIIPVYWQGSLRGVIRRRLKPGATPKYLFPKHLPRRELLWGYDQAISQVTRGPVVGDRRFGDNPVVLTEGQVDAIAVSETGARAVGLGGNRLLKTQRMHLRRMGPTSVLVALDNDEAGRGRRRQGPEHPSGVHQVVEMCRKLAVPVFIVDWGDFKDPAEVRDRAERVELVLDAQPYRVWAGAH